MQKLIFLVFIACQLCGCVIVKGPEDNQGFKEIQALQDLVGCYVNLGEKKEKWPERYLSKIVWPDNDFADTSIKFISVELISEDEVKVTGWSNFGLFHQSTFREGHDFVITDGKIGISQDFLGSLATESGNPFIGIAGGDVVLGIDESGNGKLVESTTMLGTAYIVIPIAAYGSESIRFRKSIDGCG